MYEKEIYNCPLCRENLKYWMIHYIVDEYDEDEDDWLKDADGWEYENEERDQAEREREEDEAEQQEEAIARFQFHMGQRL